MIRTSVTHPLRIADISPAPGFGRIGMTMCPGMKQPQAAGGASHRDLARDLDVIADWGAAAVLTLLEKDEAARLGIADLRAHVEARHMSWHVMPLPAGGGAVTGLGGWWWATSVCLLPLLRDGFNVLVHCADGVDRSGMIAADLLIMLGVDNEVAMDRVREVRPTAIGNRAQECYLLHSRGEVEPLPDQSAQAIADRALGAMLGLAIGDAIGTTLEFTPRDSRPRITDMTGGGPFRLQPGQWTDDTAMALALMDSLIAYPQLDEADLMRRFLAWQDNGAYSCTGTCFDIGMTVRAALGRFRADGNPFAGSSHPHSAGNGSLMRLAPVAIRHWQDRASLRDIAARQSRTTHGALETVDACIAFADVLADAIAGRTRSHVMRPRDFPYVGRIGPIMAGSWRGKTRDRIASSGYVADSLEAALWCVGRTGSYAEAVLLAANLGDDADTTAAITGQLAGALYGSSCIPQQWREQLAWAARIETMVSQLTDAHATGSVQ